MKSILRTIALCIAACLLQPALSAGQKWALLIGIDKYENDLSDLKFAVADVRSVADELVRSGGFSRDNVLVMTSDEATGSIDRPNNLNVFKRLDFLASKIGPEDTFLFYFSGHGFASGGKHFLATVNTDKTSLETLQLSAVPMELLREKMKKVRASQVVFIIDACRNDPEKGRGDADNLRGQAFSKDLVVAAQSGQGGATGAAVLFACGEGERAYEWEEKGQGAFTYYLLEALRGAGAEGSGEVTVYSVATHVQKKMERWSEERGKRQRPDLKLDGSARIVIGKPSANTQAGTTAASKKDAQLAITSEPKGATVLIDGVEIAGKSTPCTVPVEMLGQGFRTVEVSLRLEGYEPVTRKVRVSAGQTARLDGNTLRKSADTNKHTEPGSGNPPATGTSSSAARTLKYGPPVGRTSVYSAIVNVSLEGVGADQNEVTVTRTIDSSSGQEVRESIDVQVKKSETYNAQRFSRKMGSDGALRAAQSEVSDPASWIVFWLPDKPIAPGDTWTRDYAKETAAGGGEPSTQGTARYEVLLWGRWNGVEAAKIKVTGQLSEPGDGYTITATVEGEIWVELDTGELLQTSIKMKGQAKAEGVLIPMTAEMKIERTRVTG